MVNRSRCQSSSPPFDWERWKEFSRSIHGSLHSLHSSPYLVSDIAPPNQPPPIATSTLFTSNLPILPTTPTPPVLPIASSSVDERYKTAFSKNVLLTNLSNSTTSITSNQSMKEGNGNAVSHSPSISNAERKIAQALAVAASEGILRRGSSLNKLSELDDGNMDVSRSSNMVRATSLSRLRSISSVGDFKVLNTDVGIKDMGINSREINHGEVLETNVGGLDGLEGTNGQVSSNSTGAENTSHVGILTTRDSTPSDALKTESETESIRALQLSHTKLLRALKLNAEMTAASLDLLNLSNHSDTATNHGGGVGGGSSGGGGGNNWDNVMTDMNDMNRSNHSLGSTLGDLFDSSLHSGEHFIGVGSFVKDKDLESSRENKIGQKIELFGTTTTIPEGGLLNGGNHDKKNGLVNDGIKDNNNVSGSSIGGVSGVGGVVSVLSSDITTYSRPPRAIPATDKTRGKINSVVR